MKSSHWAKQFQQKAFLINCAQIMNKGKKKPNTPELHYIRGPTKSPPTPMQIGASGKTVQKKRHNLTGHNSPVGVGKKTFFTWSVSDVFAVNYEQFLISRCFEQHFYHTSSG